MLPDFHADKDFDEFLNATVFGKSPIKEIALEGEPGCGKTLSTRYIHAKRGLPEDSYARYVCNEETSVQDLLVDKLIKDGNIIEVESRLLQLLIKPSTIVLDEFRLTHPAVLASLNSILDYEKGITLSNGKSYKRHPDCVLIFTSNPISYAGVKRQHGGFLDRLPTYQMTYAKNEIKILQKKFPDVEKEQIARLKKLADLVRGAKASKKLNVVFSTRGLETALSMINNGADLGVALSAALKPLPEEEKIIDEFCRLATNVSIIVNDKGEEEVSLVEGFKDEVKKLKVENKKLVEENTAWKERVTTIIKAAS